MAAQGTASPGSVYLFCPAKTPKAKMATFEPFLAERAVERFLQAHLDPSVRDLAYAAYYADETEPAAIMLEARSVPFLAERRIVLVRGAERYNVESTAGPVLTYLESPCDTTSLLLIASHIDKRTKFYRACQKAAEIIECPEMREWEAIKWVRSEATARGKSIPEDAAHELVVRAGTHLSDVDNALTVVCNYVGDACAVTTEDVVSACADVAEEEVWALTDTIAASDTPGALRALARLVALGKREDELMGIINWLLKSAYAVAAAGAREPKISPFVARKVTPLARKLGPDGIRNAFALCTDAHFMMRTTGVDAALALELLVVKLASELLQPTACR